MHTLFGLRTLILILASFALPVSGAWATATDSDPWSSIEGNMDWVIGEDFGRTPAGVPTAWRAHRDALGMSAHTLAFTGRSFEDAHLLIDALAEEGFLAWEEALIVATYEAGHISKELARGWISLLRAWPSLKPAQRVQEHLSLRLRIQDAGLASLHPKCLPASPSNAQLVTELADIETSIPGRRLRSRIEPPPQRPEQLTPEALQHADGASIHAAISLLALTSPAAPVLAQWADGSSPNGAHCAQKSVHRFFRLMLDPRIDGTAEFEALVRQNTAFAISQRWLWRFAVHRYLMGDDNTVRAISSYVKNNYESDREGVKIMALLADIADGQPAAARSTWPSAGTGSNPTYRWVTAEAARVRGMNTEAEAALARITDSDVHFVAAWISLAAVRGALARGHGVHLALETLEDVAPPLPIYDYWRATLRARTYR